jgi:phage gp16-like protein
MLTIGYTVGRYLEKIDSRSEKIELQRVCDEKYQKLVNEIQIAKITEQENAIKDLKRLVTELQKKEK